MEELLQKMKNGYELGYTEIVELISKDLYNIARAKLRNSEDANDAVQETLIKFYENFSNLKDPKLLKAWTIKVLINECNNIYRSRKRKLNLMEKLQTNVEFRENDLDKLENKFLTEELLKSLNDKERIIVVLYFENDYTSKAISELLDMKENTVKSIIYRTKHKLNEKESVKNLYLSKFAIILIVIMVISSSVTFAGYVVIRTLKEEIIMFQITSTKAIDAAVLNEYSEKVDTDFVYSNGIGLKLNSVAMDDKLLYISYLLDFEKDVEIKDLQLETYKICDNNNNVLSTGITMDICNTYGSDYSSGGVTYSTKITKNEDGKWNYGTMFQVIYDKNYPLSNKLNISIERISALINNKRENFDGSWNFEVDLDEKFHDRVSEYYKYEPNDKIKNLSAKLNDLSFEIELEFNENIDRAIVNSNNIILQDENGEVIECFLKRINTHKNRVTYICDIGKYSKDIDKLSLYMKYDYGTDKYVDVILEK